MVAQSIEAQFIAMDFLSVFREIGQHEDSLALVCTHVGKDMVCPDVNYLHVTAPKAHVFLTQLDQMT